MAQQVTVALVDDLDGKTADETVEFGLDGKSYEIDLSSKNAERLRAALASYVSAARRPSGRRRGRASNNAGTSRSGARERNQAIREWARDQGLEVSDRGRIPAEVIEAYERR